MYNILIPSKVDKMISKIAKGDKENAVRILFAIENLKNLLFCYNTSLLDYSRFLNKGIK